MSKTYYEIKLISQSPLRIGGGGHEETDSDVMLDGRELPFIPGSSLAGVLRSMIPDEQIQKELFGDVKTASEDDDVSSASSSLVIISDGVLPNDYDNQKYLISRRDGVGLDEWGMAIRGAKYDFQVVEVDDYFRAVIECNFSEQKHADLFENLMGRLVENGIELGARTTRGYGKFTCQILKREFFFPEKLQEWLDFNPFRFDAFKGNDSKPVSATTPGSESGSIILEMQIEGSVTIRVREANAVVREDGTNPDDVTLKNKAGTPIIPGTSWAGVFRHHMLEINRELGLNALDESEINRVFGKGKSGDDSTKSAISFSESVINGGSSIIIMRNCLDRFTAAPTSGALFTNESWNGGSTELKITYDKEIVSDKVKQILSTCIMDVNLGLTSVGGGAGIGKGICKINKILVDGIDKTSELDSFTLNL